MTIVPPYKVKSAYESLFGAFRRTVEDANRELFPGTIQLKFAKSSNTEAVFEGCLYLKDWPCRKTPKKSRVDVVIKAMETFSVGSWSLTKSTVYLNYFVVSEDTAYLVQSLHYDFQGGGQTNHPFFHVQLTDEPIDPGDLAKAGFVLALKPCRRLRQRQIMTKIPTPDMTLCSVLYCLVADHLEGGFLAQLAESVDPIQGRLPLLSFDALSASLKKYPAHFKSSHWFAHTLKAREKKN